MDEILQANEALKNKNYKKASSLFSSILAQEGANADVLFGLAKSLYFMKQYSLSYEYAEKAIAIEPGYASAYFLISNISVKKNKDLDKGIHYVRLALDIEPENIEFLTFAGSVLISKGDVNNGAPLLEKAIKLDPKNWLAHGNLGISYYVRKQFDLAIESYKKSLQAKFSLFFLLRLVEPYILKHRSLLYAFSISFFIAYIIGHKLRF